MQRILVCAQDPVLAKKVRFLMERDECKVDVLASAAELEPSLRSDAPNLLVVSRQLDGVDVVDRVERLEAPMPVLVLGGVEAVGTPSHVFVVPDPVDTTAIYREATRLLRADDRPFSREPSPLEEVDEVLEALAEDSSRPLDGFDSDTTLGMDAAFGEQFGAPSNATPLTPGAFARALHELGKKQAGGSLVVEADGRRLTVAFHKGKPVAVRSDEPGESLGRALVERGRLEQAQYAEAAIRSIESGRPLPVALVELSFLAPSDLESELATSARERLVSCFSSRGGQYWTVDAIESPSSAAFELDVAHVIARGLRAHTDEEAIAAILAEHGSDYFKLKRPPFELQNDFPLTQTDVQFLEYESRAYNIDDAADGAGLPLSEAHRLLALLFVCGEVDPFTPDAKAFEDRIREERETRKVLESQLPGAASGRPSWNSPSRQETETGRPPPVPSPSVSFSEPPEEEATGRQQAFDRVPHRDREAIPLAPSDTHSNPKLEIEPGIVAANESPKPEVEPAVAPPPLPSRPAAPNPDVPPMPVPSPGDGVSPRPLAFAKPLPRGPDGHLLDVPERAISREHFQNGVNLLGKGNFSTAEEHFRDAVALCAEEHVYLIGLARAIYYNPTYRPEGKIPVLRNIVERAKRLAPDDKRVAALETWVSHAEASYPLG